MQPTEYFSYKLQDVLNPHTSPGNLHAQITIADMDDLVNISGVINMYKELYCNSSLNVGFSQ